MKPENKVMINGCPITTQFTENDIALSYEYGHDAYTLGLSRSETSEVPMEKFDVGIHMGEFQNGWRHAQEGIYDPLIK